MDQVHDSVDKLVAEVTALEHVIDVDDADEVRKRLALSIAKRVRSKSTLVVRALARELD
jgi:hypothetical protein